MFDSIRDMTSLPNHPQSGRPRRTALRRGGSSIGIRGGVKGEVGVDGAGRGWHGQMESSKPAHEDTATDCRDRNRHGQEEPVHGTRV